MAGAVRGGAGVSPTELADLYGAYIACLNARDWPRLGRFVHDDVTYGDASIGLSGYRAMLEGDVAAIPDLRFDPRLLACEPPFIASRLWFDCTPTGVLFDLPVNGRRVRFAENVFYEVRAGRIARVWSVIDRAAIAAQI